MPALIAGGLISLGVSGATAGIVGQVLFSAALTGLSLLFAPDVPKPEKTRTPLRQSIPPRIGIMGKARSGGAYMLFSTNQDGKYSIDVLALCDGESNEIVQHYLHDDAVEVIAGKVQEIGDGRYKDHVYIYTRMGLTPETAYTQVVDRFVADGRWTADHRGDGITSAALLCDDAGKSDQATNYPFGIPVYAPVIDGRRVFDPRDVTQNGTDPSTWEFSSNDNLILQAVTFCITPISKGGMGLDFTTCFLPVIDDIQTEAGICDENVELKAGGFQKRYIGGGSWYYNDNPGDALAAMLGAGDCFMAERGDGAFTVRAGKYRASDNDVIFTDKHIISLRVKRFKTDEDDVTGVVVKYNSPPHAYTSIDSPVWPRDAYATDGGSRRIRSTEVTWCQNGIQAQRLSKRIMIYESAEVTGTMVVTMFGVQVLDRRFATIQCSDDPALANATILIKSCRIDLMSGLHEIDFAVIDPITLDAWDETTEEGALQPVLAEPVKDGPVQPVGVAGVAEELDGTVRVVLTFEDPNPEDRNQGYDVIYRRENVGGGESGEWSEKILFDDIPHVIYAGTDIRLIVSGIPERGLEFSVRSIRHEAYSAYSPPIFVDTRDPAQTSAAVTAFTAVLAGANVVLDWVAPDSTGATSEMAFARVYRATSGAAFGFAVDISGAIAGSALAPMSYTNTAPAAGTYDYWVVSQNATSVSSSPNGPLTVTVP